MSKFKQRHLLEDGYWVIEFKPNGPKIQYARLELASGGVILGVTPLTEDLIRKEIAKDEGMNEWQWKEVIEETGIIDVGVGEADGTEGVDGCETADERFDAHGFYAKIDFLTSQHGRTSGVSVVDYVEAVLDEHTEMEEELEGIQPTLAAGRLLETVIDMQDATLKMARSLNGIVSGQGHRIEQIYHNTDDAEKLSRIAIIVSLFGTLATLGVAAIAFSMLGS